MEHTIFKLKRSYLEEVGVSEVATDNQHMLLGDYDKEEDHYEVFTFQGDRGFVILKVKVTGEDNKDEVLIAKALSQNEKLNPHAELVDYEVSSEDEDLYFHQVTLKINYRFDCDIADDY